MPACEIREITGEETVAIRWPVLRTGFPRETAIFDGDEQPATRHFGCFTEGQLQGVASIYQAPLPALPAAEAPLDRLIQTAGEARQLRGMAVLPEARGLGCGLALLRACEAQARGEGAALLWCNARREAAEFYRRQGFLILGEEFMIPTVGPHWRMVLPL